MFNCSNTNTLHKTECDAISKSFHIPIHSIKFNGLIFGMDGCNKTHWQQRHNHNPTHSNKLSIAQKALVRPKEQLTYAMKLHKSFVFVYFSICITNNCKINAITDVAQNETKDVQNSTENTIKRLLSVWARKNTVSCFLANTISFQV